MNTITIATRGSKLALWQAHHVKSCLESAHPGLNVTLLVIKTKGDIILDVPLAKVGGKGLFVKEIEAALLSGEADIAVHSMKDVPMELPAGLTLGIIPEREDAWDVFLSERYATLKDVPKDGVIGTSSLRRQAQILLMRPDVRIESLRGNVDTRLRKLKDGEFDAIIMAAAGIKRLGLSATYQTSLGMPEFVPAVGQGALGIEFRADAAELGEMLRFMEHPPTRVQVEAERGLLSGLEGGCQVPIAGHAELLSGNHFRLAGLVASIDGRRVIRQSLEGEWTEARAVGLELAQQLLKAGAAEILEEVYGSGVLR